MPQVSVAWCNAVQGLIAIEWFGSLFKKIISYLHNTDKYLNDALGELK